MTVSQNVIEQTEKFGAPNYHPLPIVISEAQGVWVKDPEGNKFMDMLSAYSAVNQGHRHPKIIQALKDQADRVTLTSRAFHNDQLGPWYEMICELSGKEMALPMNTGAEAVETAIKAARRWSYDVKGIAENQAEIIACSGNFHGRTMAAMLTDEDLITFEMLPLHFKLKVQEMRDPLKRAEDFVVQTDRDLLPLDDYLREAEMYYLQKVMGMFEGNVTKAAVALGMSRQNLQYRLRKMKK
jgi:acetylornithine/succinyldiaminopimelate/putrescine aminotransferase